MAGLPYEQCDYCRKANEVNTLKKNVNTVENIVTTVANNVTNIEKVV